MWVAANLQKPPAVPCPRRDVIFANCATRVTLDRMARGAHRKNSNVEAFAKSATQKAGGSTLRHDASP